MTAADVDVTTTSPRGVGITGSQSAGATTLFRRHLAELVIDELIRTEQVVRSLLRTGTGA